MFALDSKMAFEKPAGHYNVVMESVFGCPLECHRDQQKGLCSGNGVCAYDNVLSKARCFCYDTFGGDGCQNRVGRCGADATINSTMLGFLLLFVVVGLFFALFCIFKRIGALRQNRLRHERVPLTSSCEMSRYDRSTTNTGSRNQTAETPLALQPAAPDRI